MISGGERRYTLHQAELLEWATNYRGARYHAALGDPPYGLEFLGLGWDAPGQNGFRSRADEASMERDSVFGRLSATAPKFNAGLLRTRPNPEANSPPGGQRAATRRNLGANSLYQQWVTEWAGALAEHALYPGAVCAFFGGTRTFHRLAAGLEDAGFEIFDTLLWLYGQGMAKGQNISKALDARAFKAWLATIEHGLSPAEVRLVTSAAVQGGISYEERYGRSFDGSRSGDGIQVRNLGPSRMERAVALLEELIKQHWADPGLPPGVRAKEEGIGSTDGAGSQNACGERESASFGLPVIAPSVPQARVWAGYHTGLKPAWEPIVLCRAPFKTSIVSLTQEYGTGALNIGSCRIPIRDTERAQGNRGVWGSSNATCASSFNASPGQHAYRSQQHPAGRYPSNVSLDEEVARLLDEAVGELKSGDGTVRRDSDRGWAGNWPDDTGQPQIAYGDQGGPSRFFYQAKTPKWEAHAGLGDFYWRRDPESPIGFTRVDGETWQTLSRQERGRANVHPTKKPIGLLENIARLILPADAGRIPREDGITSPRLLVPFSGSGSELIAALLAGWSVVEGVEMYADYCDISRGRLAWWSRFDTYQEARGAYKGGKRR